jgi:hypothetical protein
MLTSVLVTPRRINTFKSRMQQQSRMTHVAVAGQAGQGGGEVRE